MKKATIFIVMVLFIQVCNLDVMGLGFEIQNNDLLQASILDEVKIVHFAPKDSKYDTVQIQTSAVCKMCKERLEHDMAFEKGVKSVELSLEDYKLTIIYRKDKTTEKDLKVAITEIGYDADEMSAVQKAHDRLPACCQKDNEPH